MAWLRCASVGWLRYHHADGELGDRWVGTGEEDCATLQCWRWEDWHTDLVDEFDDGDKVLQTVDAEQPKEFNNIYNY
jgi:hypothetical protein